MSYEFGYTLREEFTKGIENTSTTQRRVECDGGSTDEWAVIWEYQNVAINQSGANQAV